MEKQTSSGLRIIFLVHAIVAALNGLLLWAIPGRYLSMVGWVPANVVLTGTELSVPGSTFVDPFLTRVLGAAMLALAFSSYLGWRESRWERVALLVQLEAVFCTLGLLGMLMGLFLAGVRMPSIGWLQIVVLAAFAAAWVWALRAHMAAATTPVRQAAH